MLSRVTYPLPRSHVFSGKNALHCAEVINYLLVHSEVFVMQDIDGDRYYSLWMDTLLLAPYNRSSLSQFLDDIAQDIEVLIQYFRYKEGPQYKEAPKTEQESSSDTDCTVIPFESPRLPMNPSIP
ncbi:MAG: hypothetical protein AAF703_13325 [Cyanobacteria bacterium P01_D01_bin.105]